MSILLWTTALLTFHVSNSYILLTANLEDVHAIAKQLATSPVADQLSKIWRRAAGQFNANVQGGSSAKSFERRSKQFEDEQGMSIAAAEEPAKNSYANMRTNEQSYTNMRTKEENYANNMRTREDPNTLDEFVMDQNFAERRSANQDDEDLAALGRNASLYLKSIKKIFEKV